MLSNDCGDNNVLTIKTVQIAPFRILMAALKDILLETNIIFTKQGIKIINMDKTHTILVHLFLKAENFEFYECKHEKIIVGVNILHLFKLITAIDNDDTLTIYIENDDYNEGIVTELGLKFENGTIKQSKIQKLKLIEPEQDELEIPNIEFECA
jgi:DNA polymerase III sliding clamp (beta) subunit (PCNA family)